MGNLTLFKFLAIALFLWQCADRRDLNFHKILLGSS